MKSTARRSSGLLDVAVESVARRGWSRVTIRQVARAAGVSYGAPVARFGDESGLLAAVAERGFRLLEQELAGDPGDATALALRYVEFALRRRNLHRAMYHPDLWSAAPPRQVLTPSIARRVARSAEWRAQAEAARNACFARFVAAVIEGQMAGAIGEGPPGEIARLVTALADGFTLQTTDEAVHTAGGLERQLGAARRLVTRLEAGLGAGPGNAGGTADDR